MLAIHTKSVPNQTWQVTRTLIYSIFIEHPSWVLTSLCIAAFIDWDLKRIETRQESKALTKSPFMATYEVMKMEITLPVYWIDDTLPGDKRNDSENLIVLTCPSVFVQSKSSCSKPLHQIIALGVEKTQNYCFNSFNKRVTVQVNNNRLSAIFDKQISKSTILQLSQNGVQGSIKNLALGIQRYFLLLLIVCIKSYFIELKYKPHLNLNSVKVSLLT